MKLDGDALVQAEHNLYTFAREVYHRYPDDPGDYWTCFERLKLGLAGVAANAQPQVTIYACRFKCKGSHVCGVWDSPWVVTVALPPDSTLKEWLMEEAQVSLMRQFLQSPAEKRNQFLKIPLPALAMLFNKILGKLSLMYQEICILTDCGSRAPKSAPQKVNMRLTFSPESMMEVSRQIGKEKELVFNAVDPSEILAMQRNCEEPPEHD